MAVKEKALTLLLFAAGVVIIATLLPLVRITEWWIRIFDFPRVQIVVIGVAVMFGIGVLGGWSKGVLIRWLLSGLIGCIAYQAHLIYPYTVLAQKQSLDIGHATSGSNLRILVANVYMNNRNSSEFLKLIKANNADVILVTEPDVWWEKELRVLEVSYPYTIKHPLANTYGMLLYSRLKLHNPKVRFLIEDSIPSIFAEIELSSGDRIEFYGLHPRPPHFLHDSQERDAELLLVGREVANIQRPVIVAGDLNDVAWSYTTSLFQRISGLVDPRIGRGFFNTYHTQYPMFRFPLDYVFHSSDLQLLEMKRLPDFGSDHFPIFAALAYKSQHTQSHAPPEEDQEDRQNAKQLIKKGLKD